MSKPFERVDEITRTFALDHAYCDALFESECAPYVAELLLSHLWANTAMPLCHQGLSAVVPERFGSRQERAALWNLILLDGINRDLRLVPYLVLRGLASEGSAALRRAFEHAGVLSHIWTYPGKVDALNDADSKEYAQAFRCEVNERKRKALTASNTSKRFSTMKLGSVATLIYAALSKFDVHGGTGHRFFSHTTEVTPFTCSFAMRPAPTSERMVQQTRFLTDGHKIVCGEVIALCADHAKRSDDLSAASDAYRILASVTGEPSPELKSQVAELLGRFGSGASEAQ